jgi:hypothetical protein
MDGYCVEKGVIRQFVAMPLGEGYSVEEQITGAAEHGGVQIIAYPMKAERYEALNIPRPGAYFAESSLPQFCRSMGLAPGGRMKQEIYEDPYGLEAWDQRHFSRCFAALVNSDTWWQITGESPPTKPPSAADYTKAHLPWFDYYGPKSSLAGSSILAKAKSVLQLGKSKGEPIENDEDIEIEHIIALGSRGRSQVREDST